MSPYEIALDEAESDESILAADTICVDCTNVQEWINRRREAEERKIYEFRARCARDVAPPTEAEAEYW